MSGKQLCHYSGGLVGPFSRYWMSSYHLAYFFYLNLESYTKNKGEVKRVLEWLSQFAFDVENRFRAELVLRKLGAGFPFKRFKRKLPRGNLDERDPEIPVTKKFRACVFYSNEWEENVSFSVYRLCCLKTHKNLVLDAWKIVFSSWLKYNL
jgi:hypothetical protein